jgi:hypothetical protein
MKFVSAKEEKFIKGTSSFPQEKQQNKTKLNITA